VLAQNPALAAARLEAEVAQVQAAPGAVGLLPRVTLTAQQRRFAAPDADQIAFQRRLYTFDVGASASMTLFDGGARLARLRALRAQADAAAFDAEAFRDALLGDAFVAYFTLAGQQQQMEVLREAVSLSQERLRIAEGRLGVGAASELEARRALVDLNADRAALLRQDAALAASRALLRQILALPESADFRVDDAAGPPELERSLEALEAAALADAPALEAARADEDAARLELLRARRAYWPTLSATMGYVAGDYLDDIILPAAQARGITYGLVASWDLFDAGDRLRGVEVAELRRRQAQERTQALGFERRAALQVAYADYLASLALVDLEDENAALARENVEVALARFRLGASTSLELREVQRALVEAESRLVAARSAARAAEVDLLALAGLIR
jgi:outer membrane protein TolC